MTHQKKFNYPRLIVQWNFKTELTDGNFGDSISITTVHRLNCSMLITYFSLKVIKSAQSRVSPDRGAQWHKCHSPVVASHRCFREFSHIAGSKLFHRFGWVQYNYYKKNKIHAVQKELHELGTTNIIDLFWEKSERPKLKHLRTKRNTISPFQQKKQRIWKTNNE